MLSHFWGTWAKINGCRRGFSTSFRREALQTRSVIEKASSPWSLHAAVCLQRLPVISAACSPIEQRFKAMLQQMELEKSLMSDHELRVLEDAERIRRKQADDYDSDEEDSRGDQDIVLAQDLEDAWEQKLKSFQPAPRVRADAEKDLTSLERCLADTLLLLAEHQVGDRKLWLLPQSEWQEGETLRQTAERALASLSAAELKATFLSNAPCGVYKYKLPKGARTDSLIGSKVFFFKAVLAERAPPASTSRPCVWLKKSELERHLKAPYGKKIQRFLLEQ
uniref:Large ribosomal subunit protein mL46 n=1 Tax=Tetraodon nigroviridis TaxID=99883 RepID=H3D2Y1_TETNG